jgi:hypothetical protein
MQIYINTFRFKISIYKNKNSILIKFKMQIYINTFRFKISIYKNKNSILIKFINQIILINIHFNNIKNIMQFL